MKFLTFWCVFGLTFLYPFLQSNKMLAQTNTQIDKSFGNNGIVHGKALSILDGVVQSDGKLIIVGRKSNGQDFDLILIRYTADGSIDSSFGNNGIAQPNIPNLGSSKATLVVKDDGKIIVGCTKINVTTYLDFALIQFTSNGSVDTSFNGTGLNFLNLNAVDVCTAVAVQKNGDILVGGYSSKALEGDRMILIRFKNNGILDTLFGENGVVKSPINKYNFLTKIIVQPDDKILFAGNTSDTNITDICLTRFLPTGTPDYSFGLNGKIVIDKGDTNIVLHSVNLQPDGKIVLVSTLFDKKTVEIYRLLSDGTLDLSFNQNGKISSDLTENQNQILGLIIYHDGSILLQGQEFAGNTTMNIFHVRYSPLGKPDSSFGSNGVEFTDIGLSYLGVKTLDGLNGQTYLIGSRWIDTNYHILMAKFKSTFSFLTPQPSPDLELFSMPNPFNNYTILFIGKEWENATLRVLNSVGQVVQSYSYLNFSKGDRYIIHRKNLQAGTYFVEISQMNAVHSTHKMIIVD